MTLFDFIFSFKGALTFTEVWFYRASQTLIKKKNRMRKQTLEPQIKPKENNKLTTVYMN